MMNISVQKRFLLSRLSAKYLNYFPLLKFMFLLGTVFQLQLFINGEGSAPEFADSMISPLLGAF